MSSAKDDGTAVRPAEKTNGGTLPATQALQPTVEPAAVGGGSSNGATTGTGRGLTTVTNKKRRGGKGKSSRQRRHYRPHTSSGNRYTFDDSPYRLPLTSHGSSGGGGRPKSTTAGWDGKPRKVRRGRRQSAHARPSEGKPTTGSSRPHTSHGTSRSPRLHAAPDRRDDAESLPEEPTTLLPLKPPAGAAPAAANSNSNNTSSNSTSTDVAAFKKRARASRRRARRRRQAKATARSRSLSPRPVAKKPVRQVPPKSPVTVTKVSRLDGDGSKDGDHTPAPKFTVSKHRSRSTMPSPHRASSTMPSPHRTSRSGFTATSRSGALSRSSLRTDGGTSVARGSTDPFTRMRRVGSSLMKGVVRYQNALDHVDKSITEVTKQIEAVRHATGGADHTMFLTLAERRLRQTWVSRLDVLKTRKSQEDAQCQELKQHINSIRLAKTNIMGDFANVKAQLVKAKDNVEQCKQQAHEYAAKRFRIMADITEQEKQLERQVQTIMASCLEFDATTDMAALGRNFLIRQRDQRKAEETERRKRLQHMAAVESAKTRSAWQVALDTAALRAHEMRADEFRGYLERIFAAAQERNIDRLIARYARREGANFRAFCALNQVCSDTEELLKHVLQKRDGIEQFLTHAKGLKPKWMNLAKEQEAVLQRRLSRLKSKHAELQSTLKHTLPFVASLFHAAGCDPTLFSLDMSVIFDDVPDSLKPTRPRDLTNYRSSPTRSSPLAKDASDSLNDIDALSAASDDSNDSDSSSDDEAMANIRRKLGLGGPQFTWAPKSLSLSKMDTGSQEQHWYSSMRSMPGTTGGKSTPPAAATSTPTTTTRSTSPIKTAQSAATKPARRKQAPAPTASRVTRDTKLSARRRRISMTSLSSLASPEATAAAIKALADTHASNDPNGGEDDNDRPATATATATAATAPAASAAHDKGASGNSNPSGSRGASTAAAGTLAQACRRLEAARGNRVATLQAYLAAMEVKRATDGPSSSKDAPTAYRGGRDTRISNVQGSAEPSTPSRMRPRRPRRRNTVMPRNPAARNFLHRNRPAALSLAPPIVVGAADSLYTGADAVVVNRSNIIKALAAVETRLNEVLLVHKEQERRDAATLGRKSNDARFLSLAANLHAGVRRKKAKSPRLHGDQVPSMLSKSLVSTELVRKPTGKTELVHHHSTDSLIEEDDTAARPVSIDDLRRRKWAVEPNQRQKELEEERRSKQRQLRRRLVRLEEQQSRRDAARLLITHIRRFRDQRAQRQRRAQQDEEARQRMMRDLEDKIAQQRSQHRQEKRRRSLSQVPHLAAAQAMAAAAEATEGEQVPASAAGEEPEA